MSTSGLLTSCKQIHKQPHMHMYMHTNAHKPYGRGGSLRLGEGGLELLVHKGELGTKSFLWNGRLKEILH